MINEIVKKIDEVILQQLENDTPQSTTLKYIRIVEGLNIAKGIILAEQKEPCHECKHKDKTIEQYPCRICPRIYTDKFTPINQPQEGTDELYKKR